MARADIFSSGKIKTRKSSNEAPESVVRKIGMIVELLRYQRIARKIGVHAGFEISHIKNNEIRRLGGSRQEDAQSSPWRGTG